MRTVFAHRTTPPFSAVAKQPSHVQDPRLTATLRRLDKEPAHHASINVLCKVDPRKTSDESLSAVEKAAYRSLKAAVGWKAVQGHRNGKVMKLPAEVAGQSLEIMLRAIHEARVPVSTKR